MTIALLRIGLESENLYQYNFLVMKILNMCSKLLYDVSEQNSNRKCPATLFFATLGVGGTAG
jgi:hypothetical protein